MAIKLKIPKPTGPSRNAKGLLPRDPVVRAILIIFVTLSLLVVAAFSYVYVKYDRVIVKRFSNPIFSNSARLYAIPKTVRPGQVAQARTIAAELRHAGYAEKADQSRMGTYRLLNDGIEITPGPESITAPTRPASSCAMARWQTSPAAAANYPPTNWNRNWSRPVRRRTALQATAGQVRRNSEGHGRRRTRD